MNNKNLQSYVVNNLNTKINSRNLNLEKNVINNLNSTLINIENTPKLPDIGYYNEFMETNYFIKSNPLTNSYNALNENLKKSCTNIESNGIYSEKIIDDYLKNGNQNPYPKNYKNPFSSKKYDELNFPYYLYKLKISQSQSLQNIISNNYSKNIDDGIDRIANQIQYLACQLVNARNRYYDPDNFPILGNYFTLEGTFLTMGPNLKWPLVIIFSTTMYFLISGSFGSIDLGANIINSIQKNKISSGWYWLGIFIGLIIPIVMIITIFTTKISKNLEEIEKDNITFNPYGIKETISENRKKSDYNVLTIFILVIYGFIAILFTIRKESFNNLIYSGLITVILLIITICIYIIYSYIPYFNTTDSDKMSLMHLQERQLFIDTHNNNENEDISFIYSNQTQDSNLRLGFLITSIVLFILTICFFYFGYKLNGGLTWLKGILGSSAILILPIIWIFNFLIGVQYFYIYPIILIIVRFFRYIIMTMIYLKYKDTDKKGLSDDLIKKIDNFKNYSASWGLIGVEELKIIMGLNGFNNIFSDYILEDKTNSVNISNNKFITSGLLGFGIFDFIENKNKKGLIYSIIYFLITIFVSSIILFQIVKINQL
jgi:hypothetical protein